MPRLAYLLKKFPRLSETFILNELLGQEALGAEISVFSRRPADAEPRHPQLARLRAPVVQLPPSKEVDPWAELFGERDDELLPRVRAAVAALRPYSHPRFPSLLAEAVLLRRLAREQDVGHVHAHFATDGALVAHLLAALGGPSYSLTLHAKDIYRDTVDARLLDRLVAGSVFSVTVCDANVAHLRGMLGPAALQRVRRLYNGIDLSLFAPDGRARDAAHVLSIGRLVEKKGFLVLLDALALLAAEGRAVRATLVGEGEDRALIEARVRELGLSGRVHLAGALPQDAVLELLRSATLFALPCLVGEDGNRDALPTVLLEALAAGLPCVSTPVTGIPEILDGGRAGLLVPERDAPATARALDALLDDPARREGLARAGRAHAQRSFDLSAQARVLHGWFGEALAAADPAAAGRPACTSPA
jgi:glycosyltransferase involved in cell wall biosynthesis